MSSPTVTPPIPPVDQPPVPPAQSTVVFTQPQVDQMVSQARSDEKQKLYADVEKAKKDAKAAEDRMKQIEAELNGLKTNASDTTKLAADLERLREENRQAAEKFQSVLENALKQQEESFRKELALSDIRVEREKAIAAANGRIIPELVTGSTVEEIRASAVKARERYEAIVKDAEAAAKAEADKKLKDALPPPATPGTGTPAETNADNHGGLKAWRQMPEAEWAKNRRAIIDKAYKDAGLPVSTR